MKGDIRNKMLEDFKKWKIGQNFFQKYKFLLILAVVIVVAVVLVFLAFVPVGTVHIREKINRPLDIGNLYLGTGNGAIFISKNGTIFEYVREPVNVTAENYESGEIITFNYVEDDGVFNQDDISWEYRDWEVPEVLAPYKVSIYGNIVEPDLELDAFGYHTTGTYKVSNLWEDFWNEQQ